MKNATACHLSYKTNCRVVRLYSQCNKFLYEKIKRSAVGKTGNSWKTNITCFDLCESTILQTPFKLMIECVTNWNILCRQSDTEKRLNIKGCHGMFLSFVAATHKILFDWRRICDLFGILHRAYPMRKWQRRNWHTRSINKSNAARGFQIQHLLFLSYIYSERFFCGLKHG